MAKFFAFLFLLISLSSACGNRGKAKTYPSPKGYNLSDPMILSLRSDLDEISGIGYYPKDTSIFAINDENGMLYKIFVRKKIVIKSWRFSDQADYEDIVLIDSTFYALKSNGDIKTFQFGTDKPFYTEEIINPVKGINEFEAAYYDEQAGKLVVVCKDCVDDSKKEISAYAFDPLDNSFSKSKFYSLNTEEIEDMVGKPIKKFKPSAAAIHPVSKEIYIISAVSNTLVVADRDGNVKKAFTLNPKFFKQPEGISFTPNGDLLISNESAEIGAGNILIFKYKPLVNEKG